MSGSLCELRSDVTSRFGRERFGTGTHGYRAGITVGVAPIGPAIGPDWRLTRRNWKRFARCLRGVFSIPFELKQNDRRPVFVVVLKDDFGEPSEAIVNLTTATSAVFNMRAENAGAVKINRGTAAITNAAGGEVTYNWVAGDTDTVGAFEAEVEILWNDGKAETFPGGPSAESYWEITITDDIA